MSRKFLVVCILLCALPALPTGAQTYPGQIGIGISMGWNMPFVDAAKTLRQFGAIGGGTAPTDSSGWPTTDAYTVLWDMRPVEAWAGNIDDPEQFTPNMVGTYKCSFNGQATLAVTEGDASIANQSYNSGSNTTTFDLIVNSSGPWDNIVILQFTDTRRTSGSGTNTGITNLRCIRPGYPIDTTQIFHTPFINCAQSASFGAWRTLGWVNANNTNYSYPQQIEWSERKLWSDATQESWGGKLDGGCWESVIWLSNTIGIDPWINIPIHASDNYITQLATLFRDNLNSDRNVYVEWSNEVWNWGFWQATYNNEWAQSLGLSYITGYARRTAQIAQIWANVWGSSALNNRVRVVNCWQIGWWPPDGQYNEQMQYINDNFGPPSQLIWGLGVAPYHNCGSVCTTGSADDILDAMWTSSNDSVESRQLVKAVANNWNLPGGMLAYEGGSDTGGGDATNVANKIAAERAAGMKDVMLHDLRDNWFPVGGGLFIYLELTSGYNRYGSWGLTDDVTNPDRNYKFEAVRDVLGDVAGLPGQASNPSPGNGATGVSVNADLSWSAGSGATSYDVYFGQDSTPDSGEFQGNQAGTTFDPGALANDNTYYWRIDSVNANGTTTGAVWSFTTETAGGGLPSPWVNGDVGSPSAAGNASYSSGTFTIEGDGSDIWGTSDQFHYVYQSLSGDGEIEARVASLENTNSWAKAGVMIRETLTGGSTHAMMVVTAGNGTAFQRRTSTGGSSSHTAGSSVTAPYWVRLVRSGDTFTGYESSNGSSWNEVGSATISMGTDVYVGLAVTSHSGGVLATSEMDSVTVSGGGPQPPAAPTNLSATPGDGQVALSWDGSAGADFYNVYRGTGGNYYWQASPTSTSWTDTSVTNGTTYWYYVTAENAAGESSQSNVVSATPQAAPQPPGQAANPSPANGATAVSVNADLSWSAGSGATSYDVYFGQDSTPDSGEFQGNQTGTTFDPGTLANDTTYYWRIDSVNAAGTTTGNVWSFTTAAGGPGPGDGTGLTGDYYDNMDFTAFALTRTDATVNFNWGSGSPDPAIGVDTFSVQWTGQVEPMYSETYTFYTNSDDGIRLWVDGQLIIDNWTDHGPTENSGTISLSAGVKYDIDMDFYENGGGAVAELRWSSASQAYEIIPQTQLYPAEAGGTGTILREWWTGISGTSISDLTSSPDYPDNPSGSDEPTSFEAPTDWADNYGTRMRGYLTPTDSGDYTFWIASDDAGELWLSTDDNPANTSLIANVPGWSSSRQWDKYAEQQSTSISLTGGNDYYIEALQKEGGGGDNLAVAWQGPGISQQVIVGDYLSPWEGGGPLPPGQAGNPSPGNGATGVSVNADVSWTAGSGATSHDVYFGQSTSPPFIQNQAGTTYDPGTLSEATTYYWRIDSKNAIGTTTGVVWSFTTEAVAAGDVEIIGSWTSGTTHAQEAGTDRALVFTAHAESSTADTDLGSVTYGGQSMTKVVDRIETTTYSAYTCAFILDEAGINAASGSTFVVTWNTAPSETPAFTSVFLQNVNQSTLLGATGTGGSATTTAETPALSTNDGDMAIVAGTCGNSGTYSVINGFTEAIEVAPSSADGVGGYLPCTGADVTPGVSHTNVNRQSVIGFVVKAGAGVPPVPPDPATNPSPADGATDVSIDADLSWTAGAGATSHDVYFGTTSPGDFQGNQAGTTFDPGTLANDTTYYWRIDEKNAAGTTTGVVWSFTTEAVPPPGQATNPSPANGATDQSIDVSLSWTAGSGATSHDVYLGTDSTPDSGEFQGNQPGTSYDPGTLYNSTTYYWRIDEVGPGGTTTGVVWSFTTEAATPPPGQASNPNPANGATDVSTTTDLSWTAGSDATSHDVYFGTSSPGSFQGNQTDTTFDPGTLAESTTYYWRIDEKNAIGTTTGVVWSFTTEAAAAGDVEIIGSWTSGTTHAQEAGTDRALVFTAHAESSSADTDLGSVTYGGQSMTKVVDRSETTTYSAYTCAFILDEAGIDAASGSTFVVTWNTAPSATPAFTSVFLQNVNQSTLVGATGTGGSATTTAETPALSTNDGDMAIVAGTCGNSGTYSVINGFTEAIEVAPSSADGVGGYLPCTGADVTPGVSHTNVNRQSVIGFVVKAGAGVPPVPPDPATNPSPANGATGVSLTPTLSWTAGADATSHDVYFGQTTSPPFVQNQAGTTYDPGTLSEVTTYYWRIDEVGDGGTTTGTTWSFTTGSAACTQDYCIAEAASAPVIDGSVDSVWGDAPTDSITIVISGTVSSDTDLSGTWRALWDSTNLYYLVEVTDEALTNDSANAWDDDSVELYIDADNSKGTSYDGVNDYQYVFRWNDGTIHLGTSSATNTAGINFTMVAVTGGYNFEILIPWSTLGVTPGAGNLVGLDVHVNDDDDGAERDGKKSWYATVDDSWTDPSTFGTGELQ